MGSSDHARLTGAEGRRFGATLAFGFGAISALAYWRDHGVAAGALAALAAIALLAGLLVPTRLGPVSRAWTALGVALSRVTTPAFYALLYLLVITPMGLLRRTFSRSPVARNRDDPGFWIPRAPRSADSRRQLERQF